MAYRSPSFCFLHAARDAGSSALSSSPAAQSGWPLSRLIDNLKGTLTKLSNGTNPSITVDRGAGTLDAIDRIIIPSGHNATGTITLEADDNSGFSSPTILINGDSIAAGVYTQTFPANSERYVRVTFSGSFALEIGELWLTSTVTPTRGPDPEWDASKAANVRLELLESGVAVASVLGPLQQTYELRFHAMGSSDFSAFLAGIDDVVGLAHPFWFLSPESTDPIRKMRFVDVPRIQQDFPAPGSQLTYEVRVSMREAVE